MHAFGRKMMKGPYIVRIARQKERVAAAAISYLDKTIQHIYFGVSLHSLTCHRQSGILII
jgi:hypothetical protein